MKFNWIAAWCVVASTLVGCGGGGKDAGTPLYGGTTTSSGTTSTSTTTTQSLSLTVQLLDGAGTATTALVAGSSLRVKAVIKKNGVVQPNELVQFELDQSGNYGVLDKLSDLSDSSGAATVGLSGGTASGAGRVKVKATLTDGSSVEGAANFVSSATAQQATTLTLASFTADATQVSAYGTTGFSVQVLNNGAAYGTPVTVSFSSDCASGKAAITSSAVTNPSGVATGTFEDMGCASTTAKPVVLTASISTASAQRQLTVLPSTVGSLRFVSVNPSDASITLKGQGGNGRQENAQLTFKLVDQAGNGVANADVCFDSTTYVGGLTLDGFNNLSGKQPVNQGSATLCGSDAIAQIKYVKRTDASGGVSVQIASGTVPTPVRVRARAIYPSTATVPLETFSDSLSISTGLPLQRSFSLSVDKANIDGGNGTAGAGFDGDEATLTVRLADQFSNPVPDGTKVTFVASGGQVCTSQNGSCSTVNGSCSCKFVGSERRPKDGRVVVLAYADGLEDYIDANGNNIYDDGASFTDLPDAFVDANKSGTYSGASVNGDTDIPIPFQSTPNYVSGNGVRGNAHIRASTIIYMGTPTSGYATAVIPQSDLSRTTNLVTGAVGTSRFIQVDHSGGCSDVVPQAAFNVYLDDGFGNPLAAGTTLTAEDFSANLASKSVRPSTVLAFGARSPSRFIDGPDNNGGGNVIKADPWTSADALGNVTTEHLVGIQGVKDKCGGTASFLLSAKSPKGAVQAVRVLYEGDARTVNRGFDVRYLYPLQMAVDRSSLSVGGSLSLTQALFNRLTGITVASYSVNWGDGTVAGGASLPIASTSHTYTVAGSYLVTLTVTDSVGIVHTASAGVTVAP